MPPMKSDLMTLISAYIDSWRRMSRIYAGVSIFLRGTLIIASALVAAKLNTKTPLLEEYYLARFSVYVAAGTGIEAWLKPREKWKGFMTDCERAEDVMMRLHNTEPATPEMIDKFRSEFQTILETHREKNVS